MKRLAPSGPSWVFRELEEEEEEVVEEEELVGEVEVMVWEQGAKEQKGSIFLAVLAAENSASFRISKTSIDGIPTYTLGKATVIFCGALLNDGVLNRECYKTDISHNVCVI
jgi:hypothetical protein